VRDVTTFLRRRDGRFERGHEVHHVRVFRTAAIKRELEDAGFTAIVRRSYGDHPLAVRRRAFFARRTSR
jgi:hypothetical protein